MALLERLGPDAGPVELTAAEETILLGLHSMALGRARNVVAVGRDMMVLTFAPGRITTSFRVTGKLILTPLVEAGLITEEPGAEPLGPVYSLAPGGEKLVQDAHETLAALIQKQKDARQQRRRS